MDGGMDSLAEEERSISSEYVVDIAINSIFLTFSANARSAVHVSMGEAGEAFALS
jgi:hypothetical protein